MLTSTRRLVTAVVAVASIGGAGFAVTAAAAVPPVPLSCADALTAYNTAQTKEAEDKINADKATAADVASDDPKATPPGVADDPAKPDKQDNNAADFAKVYKESQGRTANAKAAADTACTGTPGKDGVDAVIILSPGVCARAQVTPDAPARLVRVIAVVPCPVDPPKPPKDPPTPGKPVTVVIVTPAPVPVPASGGPIVTH